jgi:Fic-DOC domain mobile mystery protein B
MTGLFDADDAATPITPEERNGLLPTNIISRSELNELEQQNILDADQWAFDRKRAILDEAFLRGLHRRMFDRVWKWAGDFRTSERNLGIAPYLIQPELRQHLDDAKYWIKNGTYEPDELALRVKHRLVSIHPFPNGNGRWSRLAGDLLIVSLNEDRFTWGSANLQAASDVRRAYIAALQAADNHDFEPLKIFSRS